MALKPYKFIVQAIVQEVDGAGEVTGELPVGAQNGEPVVLYGCDQLAEWANNFAGKLAAAAKSPT